MKTLVAVVSVLALIFIIIEAFETLVLPRRVQTPLRLTRIFYSATWAFWRRAALWLPTTIRDNFLAIFGPLSLLLLLTMWASSLVFFFATLHWAVNSPLHAPESTITFGTYLYLSATTFITLGFGDVAPVTDAARFITDAEAGLGFGFLAIVIGYLPVLYGAFSKREVEIALLDARASSPPSAGELLRRYGGCPDMGDLRDLMRDWERWSAELLESHLSYPVLMYYRSQHDRQSWLGCLGAILDVCAFVIACVPDGPVWQAKLTFAMARHASVDLALIFDTPPTETNKRMPPEELARLRALLADSGLAFDASPEAAVRLQELRTLYEPYLHAMSQSLALDLPEWLPDPDTVDNWQTSAWDRGDHFFQMGPARRPRNTPTDATPLNPHSGVGKS